MEAENKMMRIDTTPQYSTPYKDPWIIGAGALGLGFMIGSGQWDWLQKGVRQVVGSIGNLVLAYTTHSLQESNPWISQSASTMKTSIKH